MSSFDCMRLEDVPDASNVLATGCAYVDRLVSYLNEDSSDPYDMGDYLAGFQRRIEFFNTCRETELPSGLLTGLKSLHRAGDCSVTQRGTKWHVSSCLRTGVLNLQCELTTKFLNISRCVSVRASLGCVEILIDFSVDSEKDFYGNLDKLTIKDLQGLQVMVTGLGSFNWLANPILRCASTIFKGYVKEKLQNIVRSYVEAKMPLFQFLIESESDTLTCSSGCSSKTLVNSSSDLEQSSDDEVICGHLKERECPIFTDEAYCSTYSEERENIIRNAKKRGATRKRMHAVYLGENDPIESIL